MSKHTPGPWKTHGGAVWSESKELNLSERTNRVALCSERLRMPEAEIIANARLIAAAPDLAESVRCILHHIKFCGENDCDEWELAVAKLEQALTKAGIPVPNPDEHSEEK